MNGELNPNHAATRAARENWHKIAAMLMRKMGKTEVVISLEEIANFTADASQAKNITIRFDDNIGIELKLVDDEEAGRLAREQGGLHV